MHLPLAVSATIFARRYIRQNCLPVKISLPAVPQSECSLCGIGTERSEDRADGDHIDRLPRQWARELPDLDTEPMTIRGRAFRLSNLVRSSIETIEQKGCPANVAKWRDLRVRQRPRQPLAATSLNVLCQVSAVIPGPRAAFPLMLWRQSCLADGTLQVNLSRKRENQQRKCHA